jgi:site-specific DNA recombinase
MTLSAHTPSPTHQVPHLLPTAATIPVTLLPTTFCALYCRVSDHKQKTEGDGLNGQERRCRDYATAKGYQVLSVFHDDITGGTEDRPGFKALVELLQRHGPGLVVIVDDIKRFARDVELHFLLKKTLTQFGARLESPLFRFEDTPEGRFVETVMAAQAELERNQNKRQVANRMRSRVESGYWVFSVPPGYRYERHPVHKKWLVPDEQATLVREALEGFARGRFTHPMEIERFLVRAGMYGQNPSKRLLSNRLTQIRRMLRSAFLYAGLVEYLPWDISLRQGQHEAIISAGTYRTIKERLESQGKPNQLPGTSVPAAAVRVSLARLYGGGFSLRGFVRCALCDRPMAASLSRGKCGGRYGYYHCSFRPCSMYGKTIRCERMEGEFLSLLKELDASDAVMAVVEREITATWKAAQRDGVAHRRRAEGDLREMDRQIQLLAERAAETRSAVLLRSFEAKVEQLSEQRTLLTASLTGAEPLSTIPDAGTLLKRVRPVLQSPSQTWKTGDVTTRRTVARMVLPEAIWYERDRGFGTPRLSLPHQITHTLMTSNNTLVDRTCVRWNSVLDVLRAWHAVLSQEVVVEDGVGHHVDERPNVVDELSGGLRRISTRDNGFDRTGCGITAKHSAVGLGDSQTPLLEVGSGLGRGIHTDTLTGSCLHPTPSLRDFLTDSPDKPTMNGVFY